MRALDEVGNLLKKSGLEEYEIDDLIARLLDEELPNLIEFKKIVNELEKADQDLNDDRSYYIELIDLIESLGIDRGSAKDLFFKAHRELRLSECLFEDFNDFIANRDDKRYS